MHFQPLVRYFCLFYSLSNHDKIGKYFNSEVHTSVSFSCAFWFPVTFSLLGPAHGPSCFVASLQSLDSFLSPSSSSNEQETWKGEGVGRVTKYCSNHGCWNEQLDNRMRILCPLD